MIIPFGYHGYLYTLISLIINLWVGNSQRVFGGRSVLTFNCIKVCDGRLRGLISVGKWLIEADRLYGRFFDRVGGADMYALVYPIWFAMPPAMMKGYIDRVLGAAVTAGEIEARAGKGVLSGQHMLSITTSGAREAWLDEQGQVESLRTIFSRYLFHAFSMKSCEHLHLGAIVEGASKQFIDQRLEDVRQRTRAICATLSAQRYAASEPPSVADGS